MAKQAKEQLYFDITRRQEEHGYTHLSIRIWCLETPSAICRTPLWTMEWLGSKDLQDWFGAKISAELCWTRRYELAVNLLRNLHKVFGSMYRVQPNDVIDQLKKRGATEIKYNYVTHDYYTRKHWPEGRIYKAIISTGTIEYTGAEDEATARESFRKIAGKEIAEGRSRKYWLKWFEEGEKVEFVGIAPEWEEIDLTPPGAGTKKEQENTADNTENTAAVVQ